MFKSFHKYFVLSFSCHSPKRFAICIWFLSILYMRRICRWYSWWKWIILAFHSCNLVVSTSTWFRIELWIRQTLLYWTTLLLIVFGKMPKRTFRTYHSWSLSRLSINLFILSLISSHTTFRFFWSPSFWLCFIWRSISRKIPCTIHHSTEIEIIINICRHIGIIFYEFFLCNSLISRASGF